MTLEDIARKHSVFLGTIKKEFEMGVKIEMEEHSKDREQAEEIAMDHLVEDPEYYTKLKVMEKKMKQEPKEQTMADASGSYEAPFLTTVLKRDIHKLHNFNSVNEQMDAGVSAGAMYDGPIGTAGPSSPMDKSKKKKRKDPLALDEKSKTASITAASTKDMIATKKGFPKFGGPDAKFVEINAKCKTYPYCNQGAGSDGAWKDKPNISLHEIKGMKEAIKNASKKFGISEEEITKMIMKEALPVGMLDDPGNKKALRTWTDKGENIVYHIRTKDPLNIKRIRHND